MLTCRCDGIGRRGGLKIHCPQGRTGSSPVTGTIDCVVDMQTGQKQSVLI